MEIKIKYSKNIEGREPIHINELCRNCKLFRSNTILNNGYGCLEQDKDEPGKCYAFDCPIAWRMEKEDWEERSEDPEAYDDEWVVPYREVESII